MSGRASQKAETIKLVALDVDGVMTDGSILFGSQGIAETKAFNVKDGLGIKLLQERGIEVAIITGRTSESLRPRRARDALLSARRRRSRRVWISSGLG